MDFTVQTQLQYLRCAGKRTRHHPWSPTWSTYFQVDINHFVHFYRYAYAMSAPPSKKPGLSLYADLLEPDKQKQQGATITGAPVKYDVKKGGGEDDAQKKKDGTVQLPVILLEGC